jgi:hypothetical protein
MNFRKTNFDPSVRMNIFVLCYAFLSSFEADVDKLARDTKRKKSHCRIRQICKCICSQKREEHFYIISFVCKIRECVATSSVISLLESSYLPCYPFI